MAYCQHCGEKLNEGARFCSGCGTRIEEIPLQSQQSQHPQQRKQFFDGEIHKCPSCGEVLNSFSANCTSCGYELRGIQVANSVHELISKLEALESKRKEKSWKTWIQQKLPLMRDDEMDPIDKQKISLVQNFPIPNTKEDVIEFKIQAKAKMKMKKYGSERERQAQQALADAWKMKYDEAVEKEKALSLAENKQNFQSFTKSIFDFFK